MAVKDTWVYGEDRKTIVLPGGMPSRRKKLTGTRFAAALGFNRWKSPFQVWCEINKVAEPPFEGNIYTEAGLAIEPKLIQFVADELEATVVTPKEHFGSLYESVKYGFYKDDPIFDGMWDALELDARANKRSVVECKTTKRAEDWVDGPPAYYLAQALLYAAKEGLSRVYFAVSFLEDEDYAHPENFVCTPENSRFWFFDVEDTLIEVDGHAYNIHGLMDLATRWYDKHVRSGVSPEFDEKRDADYLKILRTARPDADSGLEGILTTIETLEASISRKRDESGLNDDEKALDAAKKALKAQLMPNLSETTDYADAGAWRLSKTTSLKVDEDAMKEDGVYDTYARPVESTRLAKRPKSE